MWQRARLLRGGMSGAPPAGFELWVMPNERDRASVVRTPDGQIHGGDPCARSYRTNIIDPNAPAQIGDEYEEFYPELDCDPRAVELLARSPEDFCEEPPRIAWGAWNEGT